MIAWRGPLACLACAVLLLMAGAAAAQARFSFAVLSGPGTDQSDEAAMARTLDQIEAAKVGVILHTGNFKGRTEVCSDALYEQRRSLLDAVAVPLVFVPGTADWLDCEGTASGGYEAVERLARLREMFFDTDHALGRERLRLARQSELARFRGYPENVRWQIGRVLFVGLNLPGANNNYRAAAGRNAEFDDRLIASKLWLERAFHAAAREKAAGLVILVHADPHFEGQGQASPPRRAARRLCRAARLVAQPESRFRWPGAAGACGKRDPAPRPAPAHRARRAGRQFQPARGTGG